MLGRIAVHLDHDNGCERRLRAAAQLAADHDAELIGVYSSYLPPRYAYHEVIMPDDVYIGVKARFEQKKAEIKKLFLDVTKLMGVTARWRAPQGQPEQKLALHARYCDLLIMSQIDKSQANVASLPNLAEAVVMSAGRPVIMIPYGGDIHRIGRRILFCWDQRREAARAFTDAHPILQECQELIVLTIDQTSDSLSSDDIDPHDFASYCASHGYPAVREITRSSEDVGIGNTILNAATDHSSDLIVMGAYGHSRFREWIMGGASKTLLETMTVPVLLSH